MPAIIDDRLKKDLIRDLGQETRDTLARLKTCWPDAPDAMSYFYDRFSFWETPAKWLDGDRPVIGTLCMQAPLELIIACGGAPFRLCNGSAALATAGGEILPAKTCALVKSAMGLLALFQEDFKTHLAMVALPATCDQKQKSGETAKALGFDLGAVETPRCKNSEEARFYWQNSLKQWTLALEKTTRRKLTAKRLKTAIFTIQQASLQFRRLVRKQQQTPPLLPGSALFLVAGAFMADDPTRWTAAAEKLNHELDHYHPKNLQGANGAARLLITGSPPASPGLKLPLMLEEAGARIVADQACSCSNLLSDTVVTGEGRLYDMLPAVADRYLRPCTCPLLESGTEHAQRLLNLAKRTNAHGVVFQAYSGCHPFQMEQDSVKKILQEANLPILFVESDFGWEDSGQLNTRIEAFLESVEARDIGGGLGKRVYGKK